MGLSPELIGYAENIWRRFPEVFISLGAPNIEDFFVIRDSGSGFYHRIVDTHTKKVIEIMLPRRGVEECASPESVEQGFDDVADGEVYDDDLHEVEEDARDCDDCARRVVDLGRYMGEHQSNRAEVERKVSSGLAQVYSLDCLSTRDKVFDNSPPHQDWMSPQSSPDFSTSSTTSSQLARRRRLSLSAVCTRRDGERHAVVRVPEFDRSGRGVASPLDPFCFDQWVGHASQARSLEVNAGRPVFVPHRLPEALDSFSEANLTWFVSEGSQRDPGSPTSLSRSSDNYHVGVEGDAAAYEHMREQSLGPRLERTAAAQRLHRDADLFLSSTTAGEAPESDAFLDYHRGTQVANGVQGRDDSPGSRIQAASRPKGQSRGRHTHLQHYGYEGCNGRDFFDHEVEEPPPRSKEIPYEPGSPVRRRCRA